MKLNTIKDNDGARQNRKRLGRGPGSGTGKTAGRGMKGQKSRSGVSIAGFEGGQMPLYRRLPKRGFNNPFREVWQEVNLSRIEKAIEEGKIAKGIDIDSIVLEQAGLIRKPLVPIKLLAKGEFTLKNVQLVVDGASAKAKKIVEDLGGSVTFRDRSLLRPASKES